MTFASAARQIVVAGVTAVFFQVGPLQAQDVDWNNTTNSNSWYEIDGNWVGRLAPPAAQRGRFNRASGYEVWWDSNTASATPEVGFLSVLQGDVTFWATGSQWKYRINGSGGEGSHSDFSISSATTSLTNRQNTIENTIGTGPINKSVGSNLDYCT